jgi:hypothetical protein
MAEDPANSGGPAVGPDSIVAAVLEEHPELVETFVSFGFRQLLNPVLRRTVARKTSIRLACGMRGVDEAEFLRALNGRLKPPAGGPS